MARVLIVGGGCRGRELAAALLAHGHAVRGTSRSPASLAAIEATGAEAVVANPDLLGTIMVQLPGVSVLCWLMGSAAGERSQDLHGPRLATLLERLVDTPVRGVVYEAAGSMDARVLAGGAALVRDAAKRWRMPAEVVEAEPTDPGSWLAAMTAAVNRVL